MLISVVIPAHNEENFLPRCLASIDRATAHSGAAIETIVVLNRCTDRTEAIATQHGCRIVREDAKNLSLIRNAGAAAARGEILVTIDADSWMHPRTFSEILAKLETGRYIGGATHVIPERLSLGICFSLLVVILYIIRHGLSFGLFWCYKRDFDAIGGFDPTFLTIEDVDFLRRLKNHGREQNKKFGTLWRAPLHTSCRKFDQFGDWYFFKNPRFLKRAFSGTDRKAGDEFWYDVRSGEEEQQAEG